MVKKAIVTVADASACAAKLASGKACTQAEMKATIRILQGALTTARATARIARREAGEAKSMLSSVLNKINPF